MRQKTILLSLLVLACWSLLAACNSASQSAAKDALNSLEKLKAATEVGVNKPQYGSLVIDAQAAVNQASAKLSDGEVKKELVGAIECYVDAKSLWVNKEDDTVLHVCKPEGNKDEFAERMSKIFCSDVAMALQKKYDIPIHQERRTELPLPFVVKDEGLSIIWKKAKEHIDRAAKLVGE
jgi:hypothetical protein